MQNVEGKVGFITGGNSGIGLGIAKAFVNAGMKTVITGVRQDHIDEALSYFKQQGQEKSVHVIKLDVTDREAYARAADEAERVFGKVHVLVNNAGMGLVGPIKQSKFNDWDWGIGVMLTGVVNGITIFLPRILRHGEGGHIVNTSSMAGILPLPTGAIYCTVKAAIIGLAETLRGELAADNIGVSAFCPGPVTSNIRETGRIRPEKFRQDSGFLEIEQKLEERPNSPNWMSLEECGERVLRGIRNNDLYIFTHREFKEGFAERMQAMVDAFPDEAINHARADEIKFLTSNQIYKKAARAAGGK
jgi:NADP-dependent 3-hydroxy acid dehydrogenase YdfG